MTDFPWAWFDNTTSKVPVKLMEEFLVFWTGTDIILIGFYCCFTGKIWVDHDDLASAAYIGKGLKEEQFSRAGKILASCTWKKKEFENLSVP